MSALHQIALTQISGIGTVTARNLIEHFGSAERIFEATKAELAEVSGLRKTAAEAILQKEGFERASEELDFIQKYKIQTLFFTAESFPHRLKNCFDAPVILYYKGSANLNSRKVVSIVGTRNSTSYGKDICDKLVEELVAHDVVVVSGLAHGIDSLAHKACLRHHVPTVGVLGHGLDRIYPSQNRAMAEKMLEQGGLLSEFPSQTNPDRENFPKRNRIIAGLADATIVVEASIKGGALITAELANSYNRDVFAYPGSVYDEFSAGCNYLIKTNRANLISGIKDLEYLLGWNDAPKKQAKQIKLSLNLTADEKKICDLISGRGSAAIDEIAIETRIPQSKLAITILGLEMQGILVSLPGKVYKLT
jgi:DNA processing protein